MLPLRAEDPEPTLTGDFEPATLTRDAADPPTLARSFSTPIVEPEPETLTKDAPDPATLPRENKLITSVPSVASMPRIAPAPPPEPVTRTPLAMITPPEDNLTRVAPVAIPPTRRTPIPYPQAPTPGRPPVQRFAFAAGSIFLVAVLAVVAMRPRSHRAAAGPPPENADPIAMAVEAPPPVAPPVAVSPAVLAAATPSPASRSASTSVPAPPARAEPRRHPPATKRWKAGSRPPIPLRREP